MEKIPKMSVTTVVKLVVIFLNIPIKEFTKKNSLARQMLFRNVCNNFLQIKEIFDEVAIGSLFVLFVLFEVIILMYL